MDMTVTHTEGMQFVAETRGHQMTVDVPAEHKGNDTGPTPPELFIASLGSCVGIYAAMYLKAQNIDCKGLKVEMEWEDAHAPIRIGTISARLVLPEGIAPEHARMALKSAQQCKIHNTICALPEVTVDLKS